MKGEAMATRPCLSESTSSIRMAAAFCLAIAVATSSAQSQDITEIIDPNEDGTGANMLNGPRGIAVDGLGNVYVVADGDDNAYRIDPNGAITEIIRPAWE